MSQPDRFRLAGVMGHPVLHSRSPMLHNYWLDAYGLAGRYLPLEIQPERIEAALRALPALGFSGCNLTMPHKEIAFPFMDRISPLAAKIKAINCVVVGDDGALEGHNFDGFGYAESLAEEIDGWRADAGPIVVIGAGGGARAVVAGLAERGAKEIRVINRSEARATALVADLGPPALALPWASRRDALADAALLVNTTNQGMRDHAPLNLDLARLPAAAIVSDIIYAPRETPLLMAARLRGNRVINGLGMLIHQARPAFQAWFGVMPQVTPTLRAMLEATL